MMKPKSTRANSTMKPRTPTKLSTSNDPENDSPMSFGTKHHRKAQNLQVKPIPCDQISECSFPNISESSLKIHMMEEDPDSEEVEM